MLPCIHKAIQTLHHVFDVMSSLIRPRGDFHQSTSHFPGTLEKAKRRPLMVSLLNLNPALNLCCNDTRKGIVLPAHYVSLGSRQATHSLARLRDKKLVVLVRCARRQAVAYKLFALLKCCK